jgi:hypothetical protein
VDELLQNACGTLLSDVAHLTIPAGPADVNVDGAIDILDVGLLQIAMGACAGEPDFVPAADIDHDGCVDGDDALLLLGALANL